VPDAQDLTLVEIASRHDDLLLPWLDLYETAFPPEEKLLVSTLLRILRDKEKGLASDYYLLAAVDAQGTLVGIAAYRELDEPKVAFLWYIAVVPQARGQGVGSWLYSQVLGRLGPGTRALLFEVEMPEREESEGRRAEADRRIRFYHSRGARLLQGISHMQSVGSHVPAIPMHVMVHALAPLDAEQAFAMAKALSGSATQQVGRLGLV
jgi:GNAT superfamily N-acetyltransferase